MTGRMEQAREAAADKPLRLGLPWPWWRAKYLAILYMANPSLKQDDTILPGTDIACIMRNKMIQRVTARREFGQQTALAAGIRPAVKAHVLKPAKPNAVIASN